MFKQVGNFLKSIDLDSKLTIASLILLFLTWSASLMLAAPTRGEWIFPLLIVVTLLLYVLIVSAGLKRDIHVSEILEDQRQFLRNTFPQLVLDGIRIRTDPPAMGISDILGGRSDERFVDLLRSCTSEVSLMGISLYHYVSLLRTILPPLLALTQLQLRVLVSKPDVVFLVEKEREENIPGRIQAEITGVDGMLRMILKDAIALGYRGRAEVRQYEGMTYCSLYIFDNKKAWYNPYLRRIPGRDVPVFEIERQQGGIFDLYRGHFDAVWCDRPTTVLMDSRDLLPSADSPAGA